jgi:CheY-like chemotaxis protein
MDADTVLLVEDSEDDAILLSQTFKRAGLKNPVQVFSEPFRAFQLLEEGVKEASFVLPLFVLLDLKLPGMSGFEFLEKIRLIKELDELLIIVLSASNLESDIALAYDLGAQSYLVKPAQVKDVLALVNNASAARASGSRTISFPGLSRPPSS